MSPWWKSRPFHDATAMANPVDQPYGPVFEQICNHIEQTGLDKVTVLVRQGVYGQPGKIMAFWPQLATEPYPIMKIDAGAHEDLYFEWHTQRQHFELRPSVYLEFPDIVTALSAEPPV